MTNGKIEAAAPPKIPQNEQTNGTTTVTTMRATKAPMLNFNHRPVVGDTTTFVCPASPDSPIARLNGGG
jgi:hypothetical protein